MPGSPRRACRGRKFANLKTENPKAQACSPNFGACLRLQIFGFQVGKFATPTGPAWRIWHFASRTCFFSTYVA